MMTEMERGKAIEQLILAEEKATTQTEKDIIHLKLIELSIRPYSRWWRWGYLSSVRRARQALEREMVASMHAIPAVVKMAVLLGNEEETQDG